MGVGCVIKVTEVSIKSKGIEDGIGYRRRTPETMEMDTSSSTVKLHPSPSWSNSDDPQTEEGGTTSLCYTILH